MSMKKLIESFRQTVLGETDWGGFGGSKKVAPLDTYADPNDEGAMSYEEQLKVFEMMVERGDRDPHEVLNYPQHFQNDLDFPDLGDDDVENILSKLGLPEMSDPKWQRYTIGQSAVREGAPMKTLMDGWRGWLSERDWQKESDKIKDHPEAKNRILDTGANKDEGGGKGHQKRDKKRGKSAPPGAGGA